MAQNKNIRTPEDSPQYHDTWMLLKNYRDVTWSLEVSVLQVRGKFQLEYECGVEDFLESIYLAGADLGGTEIESYARSIERSHKMLTLLDNAINIMRSKHKKGEVYYWLLYYTYLSPQKLDNVEEIIEQLQPHIRDISLRTYYRIRKEAVETLSSVLWGYTSQESQDILKRFFA